MLTMRRWMKQLWKTALREWVTMLADAPWWEVDMKINMSKTFTQHVFERGKFSVTTDEIAKVEATYKYQCDFCTRRFKSDRAMHIHRYSCPYNFDDTTEEPYGIEEINGCSATRTQCGSGCNWLGIRIRRHTDTGSTFILLCNGYHTSIRDFWSKSGENPQPTFLYW